MSIVALHCTRRPDDLQLQQGLFLSAGVLVRRTCVQNNTLLNLPNQQTEKKQGIAEWGHGSNESRYG